MADFRRDSLLVFSVTPISPFVFGETNASTLKGRLYFENGREVPFHDALGYFASPPSASSARLKRLFQSGRKMV
jgi:hypothetical protein